MIDLMLEDARQPAPGFDLHRLAMTVHSFDLHLGMALHLPHQAWDGETALHTQQSFLGYFYDLGVDHRPHFFRRVFILLILFAFIIFDDDDAVGESDLRRGKTHTRRLAHGFDHVVYQGLEFFIKCSNCASLAA